MIITKAIAPFYCTLKPSRLLQNIVKIAHLIALLAALANALPLPAKLVVALGVVICFIRSYPQLLREQRILRYSEKRGWELSDGGEFMEVDILNSTVLTTVFIFLHLRKHPAIVIVNDSLSESEYRELLVKLKMTAH